MSLTEKQRKSLIITVAILVVLVIVVLGIQMVISNIIENKIENILAKKENSNYTIKVSKAKINLFSMSLILKDVDVIPDSTFVSDVKKYNSDKHSALNIKIPVIRVRNINVFDLIRNKHIEVNKLIVKKALVEMYSAPVKESKTTTHRKKGEKLFNADTIMLKNISGLNINQLEIKEFTFRIIDLISNDTTIEAPNLDIDIQRIGLEKNGGENSGYRFVFENIDMSMESEHFLVGDGKYVMSFNKIDFRMADSILSFHKVKLKPRYSIKEMVSFSNYQYEIYNLDIDDIEIHEFYLRRFIHESRVLISKIFIDGMNISIFKDKSKPFNEEKRPKLPQQSLKELKLDMFIDSILIRNSRMEYSEKHPDKAKMMNVILGSLDAEINNITTIYDSLGFDPEMKISLNAKLQDKLDMGVFMSFDLGSPVDTFAFAGYVNKGDFMALNDILVPAIGAKASSGQLDKLTFYATANPNVAIGEMTMLYHDLTGSVVRNEEMDENKFLSWVANRVIIEDNPTKDNPPRTVPLYFDRCQYKGLGNFLWKTVQSGIMGTIVPGQAKKHQKSVWEAKGMDPKEIKKAEREEKRRQRKLEKQESK